MFALESLFTLRVHIDTETNRFLKGGTFNDLVEPAGFTLLSMSALI